MTGLVRPQASPAVDESAAGEACVRALYAQLLPALEEAGPARLRDRAGARLAERGATFGEGAGAPVFPLDPVPRALGPQEWARIEAGLAQRARALGAFVVDAYGDRRIVRAGLVPARAIESARGFEPWMVGVEVRPESIVTGFDLVRCADGVMRVLEDNIRTPSGIAYTAAARDAVDRCLPIAPPARAHPEGAFAVLEEGLRAAAPEGIDEPVIALLTDGEHNSAWYEHREIAARLGLPMVEPKDLLPRGSHLHAWVEDRVRRIDVLYRRTDVDMLRDRVGRSTWLADKLLASVRQGTLAVVNPFGTGIADDKLMHAYVEQMVRFFLEEEPILESVPTLDLGHPEIRSAALARLEELVFKPRDGLGGAGVVVCAHATADDRRAIRDTVAREPGAWVAQEMVSLSTHPTVCGDDLEPRHVDLRPFCIGTRVAPAALTRVALNEGTLVVNSSQNGGAKDTWLLA